jgi:hypothetical protein
MADLFPTLTWRAFAMPKAGHAREEYEDACAGNPETGRFAIADGATESSFARTWAELLVKSYTRQEAPWAEWLAVARASWQEAYQERAFSWYAEDKFLEGAYATFLGLSFQREQRRWQAAAVGDSCLFQVRALGMLEAFPVRHANSFGNQPGLLGSRKSSKESKHLSWEGDWQNEDQLFLMTDALAQWFLHKTEDRRQPWEEISALTTQDDFETWVSRIRAANQIRNDDVTLLIIR